MRLSFGVRAALCHRNASGGWRPGTGPCAKIGRRGRSGCWSDSAPAAAPTSPRVSSHSRCRKFSASRSWSRTGPARAARLPPRRRPLTERRLHRVDDEQRACDFGGDVQDAALRSRQRFSDGLDGGDRWARAGDGARFPGEEPGRASRARPRQSRQIQFRQRRRRHHAAIRRRAAQANGRPRHRPCAVPDDAGGGDRSVR